MEFVLGMKAEADRLAALGIDVGAPLADEVAIKDVPGGDEIASFQMTSKGIMFYGRAANSVAFFTAAGR